MQRRLRTIDFGTFFLSFLSQGGALGTAVAAVLVVAALVGTNWSPYDRQPDVLLAALADARFRLDTTPWPAAEEARFVLDESRRPDTLVAVALMSTVSEADFASSQPPVKRPWVVERTLRQPGLEPVQQLIASHERVLLRLALEPMPAQPHDWEGSVSLTADEVDQPDEFRRRSRFAVPADFRGLPRRSEPDPGRHAALQRGRGYPYTAVRGVFDLRSTARASQAATHRSYADALRQIVILDFQLERQELVRNPDRWSDWEPVDVQVFKDVAATADGFEPDVVSAQVTDSAITAPLVARITGQWRTLATHPRLAAFELSPEALEREVAFLKALVSQVDQRRKEARPPAVEKGGFTPLIRDARQLQQQFLSENSGGPLMSRRSPFGPVPGGMQVPQPANPALEKLIRDVARELDPRDQDRRLREWIRVRATADGELLLFRYFDFDVEPGTTYRYRVRLELFNPNFGRSLSEAGGQAEIVRTRTLLTPWSEPTLPVDVAENVQYFLTGIETRPRGRSPLARMKVFQYDQDLGTIVQHEIDVAFGQNIAGKAKSEQFDPAQGTTRFAEYFFCSDDVLVDALPDLAFLADLHPDLALPPHSRGAAQLVESALVVNDRHDLIALDRLSQAQEFATAQRALEWQAALAETMVKRQPDALEGTASDIYGDLYDRLYGVPPSSRGDTERRAGSNVLQRGRKR
jgi:hypothetical protein